MLKRLHQISSTFLLWVYSAALIIALFISGSNLLNTLVNL